MLLADRLKRIEKCENNVTEGLNEATVNTALQNKTTTEEYCKYVSGKCCELNLLQGIYLKGKERSLLISCFVM